MKLVNPRLYNLAARVSGATRQDADQSLQVPPILQPVITLAGALGSKQFFGVATTFSSLGAPAEDSWCARFTDQRVGVAGTYGPNNLAGFLAPGLWRITLREKWYFNGTTNTVKQAVIGLQAFDRAGTPANFALPMVEHTFITGLQPVPTFQYWDLTLSDVAQITLTSDALIAGDTTDWKGYVLAQKLF